MGAKEKTGITKMMIVIVIAAIIVIASVSAAGWWFFLRPVGKKTSTIALSLYSQVPKDQDQIVEGLIEPAVADANVTLTFTMPNGTAFAKTATSESDGSFMYTITVGVVGNWTVMASWPGNDEFEGATSTLETFTVIELAPGTSLISCRVPPGDLERGEDVTVTGQIWTSPAGEGGGVTVTLTFTRPDDSTFTETVTSESDGSFTYTYTVKDADPVGWWGVTASWPGTADIDPDTSDVAKFHVLPVLDTEHPIKLGVIGPTEMIQGIGMREGATMAAEEINEEGGILGRKLVIKIGDEGTVPERGTSEMEKLCSGEKVHLILGGFRTEITYPMREVAMDHQIPFFICGSATPWLIDCFTTTEGPHKWPCGECVRDNYERYKYLFRVMPTNTDVLFSNYLVPYMRDHLIPKVIQPALVEAGKIDDNVTIGEPGYDPAYPNLPEKIKVAAIIEALDWTKLLRDRMDDYGPLFFGPARSYIVSTTTDPVTGEEHLFYGVSPLTKNFATILEEIQAKGAHIIFECFSSEEGLAFIKQWRDMKLSAIPLGINVLSQEDTMWDLTGGRCEYEAFLSTMGTRTPVVPGLTEKFWDDYQTRWGHAPIYTSFGTYTATKTAKDIIEQAHSEHPEYDLDDPDTWESLYDTRELYDILIPYLEQSDRLSILGRAKFTSTHDIFTPGWWAIDRGQEEYVKPLVVQWRATDEGGRMAAVSAGKGSHRYDGHTPPAWAPYIEEFAIPPWMLE